MVENNGAGTKLPGGVTGKGWMPGRSGNPGGRPKGLAASVREKVAADEVVKVKWAIVKLHLPTLKRWKIDPADCTFEERQKALDWLVERGYGKAPAYAPVEHGDPLEISDVDGAIEDVLDELAGRREAQAAGGGEVAALGTAGSRAAASAGG